eukprot:5156005-Karenia_brevis.AAC.1
MSSNYPKVPSKCGALESRALFLKQLECIGAPLWPYEMGNSYHAFEDPMHIHSLVAAARASNPELEEWGDLENLAEQLTHHFHL